VGTYTPVVGGRGTGNNPIYAGLQGVKSGMKKTG